MEKHDLTESQRFGAGRQPVEACDQRASLIYISWYINDYGCPWTPSDVIPRITLVYRQVAGSEGVLLPTTDQKASVATTSGCFGGQVVAGRSSVSTSSS